MKTRNIGLSASQNFELISLRWDGKMEEIEGPAEAEARAKEFIRGRHRGVRQILFRRTHREGDVWKVEGEVWFKRMYFFTAKRTFRLQMKSETGEVTSYEEARRSAR